MIRSAPWKSRDALLPDCVRSEADPFDKMAEPQTNMAQEFIRDAKPLVSRARGCPLCLFLPDASAPAVSVQAWFPVGSLTESEPLEGVSHFLEHMIFKGSETLGVGELASMAEAAGGDVNAYTTSESTHYDLIAMPGAFEGCLEALLDALWWPRFDEEEVRREREVIITERNRAFEQPEHLLQLHLYRAAYGRRHPYGHSVLGTRRSLRRIGAQALEAYHRAFYAPASAILVFAGAFEVSRIKKILRRTQRRLLAKWPKPRPHRARKVPAPAPAKPGPRVVVRRGRSGTAHLDLAFAIPPLTHPDAPALEVLASVLGAGESSRLYERLCMQEGLMFDASAEACFSGGPGLFFLGGYAAPENARRAIAQILEVARDIARDAPATPEELEKVRVNYLTGMEFRRESMTGRARLAGYSALITGDADYHLDYVRKVLAVDARAVSAAARRYFKPARLTAGAFFPAGRGIDARKMHKAIRSAFEAGADARPAPQARTEPPASPSAPPLLEARSTKRGARRAKPKAEPTQMGLPGGGRLIMLPDGGPRVFALRAVFPGGQRSESARRAGLYALMTSVAPLASRRRSSLALTREVEALGASIGGFSGRNTFGLNASGLSAVLPRVLDVLVEVLSAPAFDPDDVEFNRAELDAERDSELDDLGQYCRFKGYQLLYGRHPLGRHPLGTRETMASFTPRVLRSEWRRRALPAHLILAVAGNFDAAFFEERLPDMLAPWAREVCEKTPAPAPAPPRVPARGRFRAYVVEGASQSHVHMAFPGATFHDPARHALAVACTVLGSQGGRLFFELREKRGLAYDVSASSHDSLDAGVVSIYAATLPGRETAAVDLIRREIERLARAGLAPEELQRAKAFLVGGLSRSHQRAAARATDLAGALAYDLGWETLAQSIARIEGVRGEEVEEAARRFMARGRECLVVVSPGS